MKGQLQRIRLSVKRGDLIVDAYGKTATGRPYMLGSVNLGQGTPTDPAVASKIEEFVGQFLASGNVTPG